MLLSANELCAKRTFTLPPAEESETPPREILHGCDYLVSESGDLEFYYNFLRYRWDIDGSEVRARHYLGEGTSVSVMMPFKNFDQPKYAGILTYLQRRYRVIMTFEGGGYDVEWAFTG
jgi:hypothetical protein